MIDYVIVFFIQFQPIMCDNVLNLSLIVQLIQYIIGQYIAIFSQKREYDLEQDFHNFELPFA